MPTGIYIHIKRTDKRNKTCPICNNIFFCTSDIGIKRWNQKKHCSKKCYGESKKGKLVFDMTGSRHSEETKRKISIAHLGMEKPWSKFPVLIGEKNPAWKGNQVGYDGLHRWIKRWLGKSDTCEHCGRNGLSGHSIQWANKSHLYKRDLTDWIRLCVLCHRKYDKFANAGMKKSRIGGIK